MKPSPFTVCVIGLWLTSSSIQELINPLEDENYHYYPYPPLSEDDPKDLQTASDSSTSELHTSTRYYTTQLLPDNDVPERRLDDEPHTTIISTGNRQSTHKSPGLNSVEMLQRTIPGTPGQDYPILGAIPRSSFQCDQQQLKGLYADVAFQCQIFHICSPDGRQYSFLCPNGTIFNQRFLVCDWWYNVQCVQSPDLYIQSNQKVYRNSETKQQQNTQIGSSSPLLRKQGQPSTRPLPPRLTATTVAATTTAAATITTTTTTSAPVPTKPSITTELVKGAEQPFVIFGENEQNETIPEDTFETSTSATFGTRTNTKENIEIGTTDLPTVEVTDSIKVFPKDTNTTLKPKGPNDDDDDAMTEPTILSSQNDIIKQDSTLPESQVTLTPPPPQTQPTSVTTERKVFRLPGPYEINNAQSLVIPTVGGFVPSSGPPLKKSPATTLLDAYVPRSFRGEDSNLANGQFQTQNKALGPNRATPQSNFGYREYKISSDQGWQGISGKQYVTYY